MRNSCFVRKIDELGRIVLPIEIRQALEIKEKDALEIFIKDDGVFIKKNIPACIFCNSTTHLNSYVQKNICKDCINNIKSANLK